jgi:O-antigen/teichoic acid export membrane protein
MDVDGKMLGTWGGRDMSLHYPRAVSGKLDITWIGFWRLSTGACTAALSFCSSILVTRTLGPSAFGKYTLILWLATVMIPAIGIGTSTLTSRHATEIQSREMPRLAAGIFYFVWRRQCNRILLYCLIYLLLVFPCSWFFGADTPILLLLLAGLSVPPLLLNGVASITLRSLQRFDLIAAIHMFGILAMLVMMLIAVQVPGELITLLLIAAAIANTLTLIVSIICITRLLPMGHALPPGLFLKERLTRGLNNSFLLFILDVIVWQRGELLLLAHWRSAAELGTYMLSSMLSVGMMDIPPILLLACILPFLLRYVPGQRYSSAADAFVKTSCYMALLAVPLCLLMMLFCPAIISYCFGNAYLPAVTPLRILLISTTIGSIATVISTYLANGECKGAQTQLGMVAAVLNIVLSIPCILLWGITGAALASTATRVVSAVGSIVICKRSMGV